MLKEVTARAKGCVSLVPKDVMDFQREFFEKMSQNLDVNGAKTSQEMSRALDESPGGLLRKMSQARVALRTLLVKDVTARAIVCSPAPWKWSGDPSQTGQPLSAYRCRVGVLGPAASCKHFGVLPTIHFLDLGSV